MSKLCCHLKQQDRMMKTVMFRILGAALVLHLATATCTEKWTQQRDQPAEYNLVASVSASDAVHCIIAARKSGVATVAFSGGSCSMLTCRLGEFGCRKCRNALNSSLPLLWMRQLNGERFCWRTFQHRVDAAVDFYRGWSDYVRGFGQGEDANFWMGLDQLHHFTKDAGRRVRWEFSYWNGNWSWSENPNFSVGRALDKYRASMGEFDSYRSSIDQFAIDHRYSPNGKMFSTFDSDNDENAGGSCAAEYGAGWWFGRCSFINPNAKFYEPPTALDTSSAPSRGLFFMPPALNPSALFYSMKTFECLLADSL